MQVLKQTPEQFFGHLIVGGGISDSTDPNGRFVIFGSDKIFCRYGAVYAAEGCLRSGVIVRTFLHFVQVREEQLGTDSLCF